MMLATVLIMSLGTSPCRQLPVLLPADGATNVPLNAIPRGLHVDGLEVKLFRGDVEVKVDARVDNFFLTSFVPSEPLMPNTEYALTLAPRDERTTFTTGDGRDAEAPTQPSATIDGPTKFTWNLQFEPEPEPGTLVLVHHGERLASIISSDQRILDSNCSGFFLPATAKFDLEVQLMDVAGNMSEPTTVRDVRGATGCSTAPGVSLLLLAVLLSRRRSSRS